MGPEDDVNIKMHKNPLVKGEKHKKKMASLKKSYKSKTKRKGRRKKNKTKKKEEWTEATTDEGETYYYNEVGKTSWENPKTIDYSDWLPYKTDEMKDGVKIGTKYYHSEKAGWSSWEWPPKRNDDKPPPIPSISTLGTVLKAASLFKKKKKPAASPAALPTATALPDATCNPQSNRKLREFEEQAKKQKKTKNCFQKCFTGGMKKRRLFKSRRSKRTKTTKRSKRSKRSKTTKRS